MRRYLYVGVFISLLTIAGYLISRFVFPPISKSANFTNASATMGNSRFSFVAGVTTGTSGSSNVTIDTTGNPDKDVDHLFPKDVVCFAPSTLVGCHDDVTYTVASTEGVDLDQFTVTSPLATTLDASDLIFATQSGTITISVTLAGAVPDGGDIYITIPMANSAAGNDGFPDYAATVADSGFDLNGLVAGDLAIATSTGGTCNNAHWSVGAATITPGSGATDHTIRIDRSGSACDANNTVLTITLGDSGTGIVNPAPMNAARTQGHADEYTINIKTRDNTDATIDNSNVMVAPIEAVLVSATVQETLSFTVTAVNTGTTVCSAGAITTDVTTTAMAVPWGTIATTATFFEAAQLLTVSTNANSGYSVTIQEADQMGKDGVACSGTAPSSGHFTFSGPTTCIRDSVCGATPCTETAGYGWTDATTYPGLGFSLENTVNTDAAFLYSSNDPCTTSAGAGTFCARQIADVTEGGETPGNVMYANGPRDASATRVCYRISVPGTQPAGYYYNKVRYTAIPVF